MHTISRYVEGKREYQHVSDILRTLALNEDTSHIVFKDGTEWMFPWDRFTLNMILGHIISSHEVQKRSALQKYENDIRDYMDRYYTLALSFVPHDDDVWSIYDTVRENPRWKEALR
jgi:hypothetical protein